MRQHLMNFLAELKRYYNIVFEYRPISEIRSDYYAHRWISKRELEALFETEKQELTAFAKRMMDAAAKAQEDYNHLMGGFNLATHRNYLETK
jgi:hypothetical protein